MGKSAIIWLNRENMTLRKRIFDIIQIGNKKDVVSRWFDYILVTVIVLNISVLFLDTFDELNA